MDDMTFGEFAAKVTIGALNAALTMVIVIVYFNYGLIKDCATTGKTSAGQTVIKCEIVPIVKE